MQTLTTVIVVLLVIWTIIPLFRHEVWWIRAFDFPRMQVLVLSCASLIAYLATHDISQFHVRFFTLAILSCIAYQVTWILPYTRFWPTQMRKAEDPHPDRCVRIVAANVLTSNRNAADLLKQVREADPDIVLAVETDDWWQAQLDVLETDFPHSVKHPLNNLYGMHLYSKLKLVDPVVDFLVENDRPSIHARVELRSGDLFKLHCLHPAPPSPTENHSSKQRDAELIVVARSIGEDDTPTIVVGDLNDVAWSSTTRLFQRISGLLDPRIGRGFFNTFHARWPFLRWPLDHVFCSTRFTLVSLARLRYFGSDHFPILATVCLEASRQTGGTPPRPTHEDIARADRKLDKVDAERPGI